MNREQFEKEFDKSPDLFFNEVTGRYFHRLTDSSIIADRYNKIWLGWQRATAQQQAVIDRLELKCEKLKIEAISQACDAKAHKTVVHKIYHHIGAMLGTWNGSRPVVEHIENLNSQLASAKEFVSFEFNHKGSGETVTVQIPVTEVREKLIDDAYDLLGESLCSCHIMGESNNIDCSCIDYAEAFELVKDNQ
jgi:hypothetical protein